MKDSLRMYNSLVERCFLDCVNDFTTRSLSSKEVRPSVSLSLSLSISVCVQGWAGCGGPVVCAWSVCALLTAPLLRVCVHARCCGPHRHHQEPCVNKCCDKFLKLSSRVGQRFAEQNVLLSQQQQQQQQPSGTP
jgi:hypothetical protein